MTSRPLLIGVLLLAAATRVFARVADGEAEFAREPGWSIPTLGEIRERVDRWARGRTPLRAAEPGPSTAVAPGADPGHDVLGMVFQAMAEVDPRVRAVRDTMPPDDPRAATAWLDDAASDPFERDVVRLWLGRELVRRRRFDEALSLLVDLDPLCCVDPATLLFHRAACQHWLLDVEAALLSLDLLLERESEIPCRYAHLGRLMRDDLAGLEDGSLDHVARRMRDVTRRLELGRAGPDTRAVQQGVVAALDRLIESLERGPEDGSEGQQAAASGSVGEQGGAARPMDESRGAGGGGAGQVRHRELGSGEGWGSLPPREREEALQQLGREFPAHYRDVIESYFERLATGGEGR